MSTGTQNSPDLWSAPTGTGSLNTTIILPGSKSQTSRAFVIGTIAKKPTVITGALASRDTYLAAKAMVQFGAKLEFKDGGNKVVFHPPKRIKGAGTIDCGLAGTVMRFGSALAAFADGKTAMTGDEAALSRPLLPLMETLHSLGARIKYEGAKGYLPLTISGHKAKRKSVFNRSTSGSPKSKRPPAVGVDTTSSSQYLSALLLASPLFPEATILRAEGRLPSWPYVAMSIDMLRDQGVAVLQTSSSSWLTSPTRPAGNPITIEPDLANAGPFLAAALLLGGSVTIKDWPAETDQVGKYWLELLPKFGATIALSVRGLTVSAPAGLTWPGVELDLGAYGELAPTVAALCAFATSPSNLIGIGHLRGHETDRLLALKTEIEKLGGTAHVQRDGLRIVPGEMQGADLDSYNDHRMATFGAIIGLRVPGCRVLNIGTTVKTLPGFTNMWQAMLAGEPSPTPLVLSEVMENPLLVEDDHQNNKDAAEQKLN